MTDAALVRMVQHDPLLQGVSVLVVDEAHERSLNTDLVLGIAKQIRGARPDDFHVVVASATIDPRPFVRYFVEEGDTKDAMARHVLEAEGRVFPVDLEYRPHKQGGTRIRLPDHVIPILVEALEDHPDGHALVFLPGSADISKAMKAFRDVQPENVDAFPLYGSLSAEEQQRVFEYDDEEGTRRMVVFCTNIAEVCTNVTPVDFLVVSICLVSPTCKSRAPRPMVWVGLSTLVER